MDLRQPSDDDRPMTTNAVSQPEESQDPVLQQRAQMKRLAIAGKRIGYGLFLTAMTIFFVGFSGDLTKTMTNIIVVCLVVGSIVLAPAIVLGYAVGAAAREDRQNGRT